MEKAVLPMMKESNTAEPYAAFDPDAGTLDRVCSAFEIKRKCTSLEEMLEADGIDAVYIASPNVYHKAHTVAAAKAGKHVFCQKPMAMNSAECEEMIAVCKENGVRIGIGFCYRFQGAQETVKKAIDEGSLGTVSYIHMSFGVSGYSPESVGWRCDPAKSGGGPLMDIAPHLFDLANHFLDDRAVSVIAFISPQKDDRIIETDAHVLLEYSKGAHVCVDTSFIRGSLHNYTVIGDKGMMRAVGTMCWNNRLEVPGKGRLILEKNWMEENVGFGGHEHIRKEIELFCEALSSGTDVPVPGEAGLECQKIIDAAYRSAGSGSRIPVR